MKITAIGGDARMEPMLAQAARRGILTGERDADIVVAPDRKALEGVRGLWKPDARICLYAAPAPSEGPLSGSVVCLAEDEEYAEQNARLTAEGAVVRAGDMSRGALLGAKCAIIGFGRIGKALCRRLLAMEAREFVAARRAESRDLAEDMGAEACSTDDMARALDGAEFVFNTVPARIISPEDLRRVSADAIVMDLASPPFGFDLDAARALGLRAARESGLPGHYCPRKAGRILLEAVLRCCGEVDDHG